MSDPRSEVEALDFLSKNRGISGFIADDDPTRPVDEWEPYVADLRARLNEAREALDAIADANGPWLGTGGEHLRDIARTVLASITDPEGGTDG